MPSVLRRYVAREGHEATLRQALLRVHETDTRKNPQVMESMLYRERFLGAEFVGLVIYDDEAALATEARQRTVAKLDQIAAAHTTFHTPSLRCDFISEFLTVPHTGAYGIAGLFTGQRVFANELALQLSELASDLVERFRPTRMLVVQVRDAPETFLVLGDSDHRIDVDRYLQSSLHEEHRKRFAPLAAAPTRWFAIDPVWRYFRRLGAAPAPDAGG
jgi:hypothetical protein